MVLDIYINDKYNEIGEELFKSLNEIIDNDKQIKDYILFLTTTDENIYEINIKNIKFIGFFNEFMKIKVLDEHHLIKYSFINLISIVPKDEW